MARPTAAEKRAAAETSETPPVEEAEAAEAVANMVLSDDLAKRPVIVKLARIMASLPTLDPTGVNKFHNYKYITDKQVNGVIRPRMAKERLMVIPDVVEESWVETPTAKGGTSWTTKLKINFTVIDGDSGDTISGHGFGYGDDTGDKGANKALTAAMKYWLIKLFQIGGEDDLEADDRADERAAQRQSGAGPQVPTVIGDAKDIGNVERGGHQDKISSAQMRQIGALTRDLELTPEGLAERFDRYLGFAIELEPDVEVSDQVKKALMALSGDDAGVLLSKLVDEKDDAAGEGEGAPYG